MLVPIRRILPSVLLLAALGCGGDSTGPGDVIPAALAGTWVAEPACLPVGCGFTLYPVASPADSLNFTQLLGTTTRLVISSSGNFRVDVATTTDTTFAGQATVVGSTLIVTDPTGVQDTIDWSIQNELLRLNFRNEFLLDLNGDQQAEVVRARGAFKRQ